MKWPWRKQSNLKKTTRLYALYGESANINYLRSAVKNNTNNIQVNKNQIVNLENRINNLPSGGSGVSKEYVDTQDNALSNRITTNTTNLTNLNNKISNVEVALTGEINGVKTKVETELKPEIATLKRTTAKLEGVSDQRWTSTNIFDGYTGFGARINMNSNKIINLATPTEGSDAANKAYVDAILSTNAKIHTNITYNKTLRIEKNDIKSGIYFYTFNKADFTFSGNNQRLSPNSNYLIQVVINRVSTDSSRNDDGWVIAEENVRTNSEGRYSFSYPSIGTINTYHMSTVDYSPGAGGTVSKTFTLTEKCYQL